VIAWACISIGGCGGQAANRGEQAQVRHLLPEATNIRCARDQAAVTRCQALVGSPRQGLETWFCEFTDAFDREHERYSGTRSCWSRNGTQESLRLPAD
jgi:hypothetical protein